MIQHTLQDIQRILTERNKIDISNDQLLAYDYITRVDKSRVIPNHTLKQYAKELKHYAELENQMHQPL